MKRGKFIVFEGLDRTGKTTILQAATQRLCNENKLPYICFKGVASDTEFGKSIKHKYSTFWFLVDLILLTFKYIKPALNQGYSVLQDKYNFFLEMHYPECYDDLNPFWLWLAKLFLIKPDLILYFETDEEIQLRRLSEDRDNHYHLKLAANPELLSNRKKLYEQVLEKSGCRVIKIDTSDADIAKTTYQVVEIIRKEINGHASKD